MCLYKISKNIFESSCELPAVRRYSNESYLSDFDFGHLSSLAPVQIVHQQQVCLLFLLQIYHLFLPTQTIQLEQLQLKGHFHDFQLSNQASLQVHAGQLEVYQDFVVHAFEEQIFVGALKRNPIESNNLFGYQPQNFL